MAPPPRVGHHPTHNPPLHIGPVPRRLLGHRRPRRGPPRRLERLAPRGNKALAGELKGARYALWKNPEILSSDQRFRLAIVAKINHPLYKAYLLKEQLRLVFRLPTRKALALLDSWLAWASRSRLAPFVEAAKTIRAHRSAIEATLVQGCSRKGRAQCS